MKSSWSSRLNVRSINSYSICIVFCSYSSHWLSSHYDKFISKLKNLNLCMFWKDCLVSYFVYWLICLKGLLQCLFLVGCLSVCLCVCVTVRLSMSLCLCDCPSLSLSLSVCIDQIIGCRQSLWERGTYSSTNKLVKLLLVIGLFVLIPSPNFSS